MPPRASLKTFLATARAALTAPPSKRQVPLTFVVGNESADLDSLCSALLLAYFHTYTPPQKQGTLHIPICHLQRADLALRPEFAAVLRDAEVDGEDMLTLEDVLPDSGTGKVNDLRPEDTNWLLVDHNAMTGHLAATFASRVIGCVDHHADEGVIPPDAEVRIIETSGSCMSLVLERCNDAWSSAEEAKKTDAQLARVALAPILIDTLNIEDANKTTKHDERAVPLAEARIFAYEATLGEGREDEERYDRTAFFGRISALKEDISDMSLRDVLRKDYKEWSVPPTPTGNGNLLYLGTSSAPRGFGYLVKEKAGGDAAVLARAIADWGIEKDSGVAEKGEVMDLVVLLTGFRNDEDGQFARELLVSARSEAGVRAARKFEETWADRLGLGVWGEGALDDDDDDDGGNDDGRATVRWRRCWTQRAVEHSRKQIAPMLRDALAAVA